MQPDVPAPAVEVESSLSTVPSNQGTEGWKSQSQVVGSLVYADSAIVSSGEERESVKLLINRESTSVLSPLDVACQLVINASDVLDYATEAFLIGQPTPGLLSSVTEVEVILPGPSFLARQEPRGRFQEDSQDLWVGVGQALADVEVDLVGTVLKTGTQRTKHCTTGSVERGSEAVDTEGLTGRMPGARLQGYRVKCLGSEGHHDFSNCLS